MTNKTTPRRNPPRDNRLDIALILLAATLGAIGLAAVIFRVLTGLDS